MAKKAMPFATDMVLFAATRGSISVSPTPQIKYRIHESNQTNVLAGVKTKEDYYEVRIAPYLSW